MIKGFKEAAVRCGIKKDGLDLGLIYSEKEATVAALFTKNRVKAAPVIVSKIHLEKTKGRARAIIVNSGNANACTGEEGIRDALSVSEAVAEALGIKKEEVLVASTGIIGKRLELKKIKEAIPDLVKRLSYDGIEEFSKAILTTDKFPKVSSFEGDGFRIVGIAKGAGMIMPDLATMLCFILTDIKAERETLKEVLKKAVDQSFNKITVDGDTSTNDTVFLLANGISEKGISEEFEFGLKKICTELSEMIVDDGEGSTKKVKIIVKGAAKRSDAKEGARSVANSLLVKTALFGEDPNWGRIMAAIGKAVSVVDQNKVDIWIDDIKVVENGKGKGNEDVAKERMKKRSFSLTVDLKKGPYEDWILTCDLSYDYVKINAEYRT